MKFTGNEGLRIVVLLLCSSLVAGTKIRLNGLANALRASSGNGHLEIKLKAAVFVNNDTDFGELGGVKLLTAGGACVTCGMRDICSSPNDPLTNQFAAEEACRRAANGTKFVWRRDTADSSYDFKVVLAVQDVYDAANDTSRDFLLEVSSAVDESGENNQELMNRQVSQWYALTVMGDGVQNAWLKHTFMLHGDFRYRVTATTPISLPESAEELYSPVCVRTNDTANYSVTEYNMDSDGFSVEAACALEHHGSAVVHPCTEDLQPYVLSGCEADTCTIPQDPGSYELTVVSLERRNFRVYATCSGGYDGDAFVAQCSRHDAPFSVSGCHATSTTSTFTTTTTTSTSTTTTTVTTTTSTSTATTATTTSTATTTTTTTTTTSTSTVTGTTTTTTSTSTTTTTTTTTTSTTTTTTTTSTSTTTTSTSTVTTTTTTSTSTATITTTTSTVTTTATTTTSTSTTTTSTSTITGTTTTTTSTSTTTNTTTTSTSTTTTSTSTVTTTTTTSTSTITGTTTTTTSTSTTTSTTTTSTSTATTTTTTSTSTTTGTTTTTTSTSTTTTTTTKTTTTSTTTNSARCVSPSPNSTDGYVVSETELHMTTFDVQAVCANGFEGVPGITPCSHEDEAYTLSGCTLVETCVSPSRLEDYWVTEVNLRRDNFSVVAECGSTHVGNATAVACDQHLGTYQVVGCEFVEYCFAPMDLADGYVVDERMLERDVFRVNATCAPGYLGEPVASVCPQHATSYQLGGCELDVGDCLSPVDTTGFEKIAEDRLGRVNLSVEWRCATDAGYLGAAEVAPCQQSGQEYSLTGCYDMCYAPTDSRGYIITEQDLVRDRFEVLVACKPGYTGLATVTPCNVSLVPYTLSGCARNVTCSSPANKTGYAEVMEEELYVPSFSVVAVCDEGYVGTAEALPCTDEGQPYNLMGCALDRTCLAPVDSTGYILTEIDVRLSIFEVSAICGENYEGFPSVLPCSGNRTRYVLQGCVRADLCMAPNATEGYAITETELWRNGFDVSATCGAGFFGDAQVTACDHDLGQYSVSGCIPVFHCVAPADTENYTVDEVRLQAHLLNVTAACKPGYIGTAIVSNCSENDEPYTLSGCYRDTNICLAPFDHTGYIIEEYQLVQSIFNVSVRCMDGYLSEEPKATVCDRHLGNYSIEGCSELRYCYAPVNADNYTVKELDLLMDRFSVNVTCRPGFIGSANVTTCSASGQPYTLSGCYLDTNTCLAPNAETQNTTGYIIVEHDLVQSLFNVSVRCKEGYISHGPKATVCDRDLGSYVLEGCTQLCYAPAESENYSVTEVELQVDNFSVNVTCRPGYTGNASATMCGTNGTPYSLSGCYLDEVICLSPNDTTGYIVEEHNLAQGTMDVGVQCEDLWINQGARVIPCDRHGGHYSLEGCFSP